MEAAETQMPVDFDGFDYVGPAVPKTTLREKIDLLEKKMFQATEFQIDFEKLTRHYFSNGLYCREITIPAGTLLTGKIHLTEHVNIVSKGDISVMTENGIERVKAPATLISKPGTKRVGYAHEETVWTTIHANPSNEQDLVKLEEKLIAPSHEAYELAKKESLCLG